MIPWRRFIKQQVLIQHAKSRRLKIYLKIIKLEIKVPNIIEYILYFVI